MQDRSEPRQLKRVLNLRDLLIYGMVIMQVVAPIPIFGLLEQRSNNHAVTTVLDRDGGDDRHRHQLRADGHCSIRWPDPPIPTWAAP